MRLNVLTLQVYTFNNNNKCCTAYVNLQLLSAGWNSVYRKIFHCKPLTSVRELIHCLHGYNEL